MNRSQRAATAAQTLKILDASSYTLPNGQTIDLAPLLRSSVAQTRLITPSEWPALIAEASTLPRNPTPATIEVTPETTLAAAHRLVDAGHPTVLALNFASAKNPGGGFLSGSLAQEESLAIASGLYPSLLTAQTYYTENRRTPSLLYTDHAILTPRCPVFRDDTGALLPAPYPISFLTMPAPNRGTIPPGSPDLVRVTPTLQRRITQVLSLAALTGHSTLILGAWGCGVFRNDPAQVAALFSSALFGPDAWAHRFSHITFAVYDRTATAEVRTPFERQFTQTPQRVTT